MNTDNRTDSKSKTRDTLSIILNSLIVLFAIIGTVIMMSSSSHGSGLTAKGLKNLRYFTVLSNEFCAIVSLIWLIYRFSSRRFFVLPKLIAAAAVGLTFVIVAFFLAPMYPALNLYKGGNLWFHLIIPVTAMIEFLITGFKEPIPFRYTLISAISALVYGIGYLINILINGIGKWPDTNDWYGFLNWGYPVGFAIFASIILMNWIMACLLRFLNKVINKS